MSGQKRLLNSMNTLEKGSISTLSKNLLNENEAAKKYDKKDVKKEKKKTGK